MKISILIPAYNVEKYINRCLDSVFAQSSDDYEVIVVDDGSSDRTKEVLKQYQTKYFDKIKLYFNEKNKGLSFVRNELINLCNTEYFIFLDSDDSINADLLSQLENTIESTHSDVIRFQSLLYKDGRETINKYQSPLFENLSGIEAVKEFLISNKIFGQVWLYCYKKSLFTDNNIIYPVGMIQEDYAKTIWVLACAENVTSINYEGYNYYRNPNSIMETKDEKMIIKKAMDVLFHYDNLIELFSNESISEELKLLINRYLSLGVIGKLKHMSEHSSEEYLKMIKERKIDCYSSLSIAEILKPNITEKGFQKIK